jgi:hypothetical protein
MSFSTLPQDVASGRYVMICSPFSGDIDRNIAYAKTAMRHAIFLREIPFAPHLLYPQPGILSDSDPLERAIGMTAGILWLFRADALVVYSDYGISSGMAQEIEEAKRIGKPIDYRLILSKTEKKEH